MFNYFRSNEEAPSSMEMCYLGSALGYLVGEKSLNILRKAARQKDNGIRFVVSPFGGLSDVNL